MKTLVLNIIILFLIIKGNLYSFHSVALFAISPMLHSAVCIHTNTTVYVLTVDTLMSMRGHLTMVWICISSVKNHIRFVSMAFYFLMIRIKMSLNSAPVSHIITI